MNDNKIQPVQVEQKISIVNENTNLKNEIPVGKK
jgi:hypothetical protein